MIKRQRTTVVAFKDRLSSKTVWFNVVGVVLAICTILSGPEALALIPDQYEETLLKIIAFVAFVGNYVLREFTTQPLKPIGGFKE